MDNPYFSLTKDTLIHLNNLQRSWFGAFIFLVSGIHGPSMAQHLRVVEIREEGGQPLSFAHVENLTRASFTLADERGIVRILNDSLSFDDTYKITHVGHVPYYLTGLGTTDTTRVFLMREMNVLKEVPVTGHSFRKSKRYRTRCNANTSMVYTVGQMFSKQIELESRQVELNILRLNGKGDWDSMVVRISLLDTLSYSRHMLEGKLFTAHNNRLSLENLKMYASDQEGSYYLNFEVVAFYGSQTKEVEIFGCSSDNSEGIMIKGKLSYPNGFLSSSWHYHPYWEPRLELGFRYKK